MSKYVDMTFCELPDTPLGFDVEKFKMGDPEQKELYTKHKRPFQTKKLTYTEVTDELKKPNYARFVPEGCVFVLGDYRTQAEDSRDFGCISLEDVKAKVITILRRREI